LIAPGFTHEPGASNSANPVVTALLEVADRLRAMVVADCPNGTREQATTYQAEFTSARLYSVYPWAKVQKGENVVEEPLSPRVAGLIAKSDNDRGFWWSPSNQEIKGIIGLSKPVDFTLGDSQCVANYLNEHKVATVIQQDGYRLWGNRTASSDTKWQFLSVRRTADLINDSLLAAHLWAIDRNINRTYTEDVCESVNSYLRYLKNIGAIINGTCWADKNLNTSENIQLGNITFDFDFTPSFPAEHITFRSRLTSDYLEEIFE
jgi:phage tail sheath protein FI